MKNDYKTYHAGFGDHAFIIACNNPDAKSIADFLFQDFQSKPAARSLKNYTLVSSGSEPIFSLQQDDRELYSGSSRYQLAYTLINEVIFHCINANNRQHAIHAGCVYRGNRCLLLPGKSGNGKSTLTSWLLINGFHYLTDELVFLDSEAMAMPMTRPVSLKVGPGHPSWLLADNIEGIITCPAGSMIPHRLFNPVFQPVQPKITDIIFPQFSPDAEPGLRALSPARSSLYLLQSHVNARNLKDHGVAEIASMVKQCRSFTLSYSSFDDLQHIFTQESELFA